MRCLTQMKRWTSEIDVDGLITKQYNFDTTDKSVLAGQARAALQKLVYPEINYEVEIIKLPKGIRVGDKINIVADYNQLYLEARVLQLQTSVVQMTTTAVIGEYLIKDSGISKYLEELAKKFSQEVKNSITDPITVEVASSAGDIFTGGNSISTTLTPILHIGDIVIKSNMVAVSYFNSKGIYNWRIKWYVGGTLVATNWSYTLTSSSNTETVYAVLEID